MIIMGSRHLTSPSPTCTACGSTSRGQVCHTEASWRCTPFTGDTRSSLRHTGLCAHALTGQTFVGVSPASVHVPGLSCRHVTRSAHRASGYQQAAICYSWCSGGSDFSRAEPAAKTHYVPRQQSNDQDSNLCNTRSSQRDTQLVLHRAVVISHQRGQESCH